MLTFAIGVSFWFTLGFLLWNWYCEHGHIRAHSRHRHHEALVRLKQSGKVVKTTRERIA
jgi:hypothetical protein